MAIAATEGLTMQYPRVRALDALTLSVPEGITGVVGVNGAGKSTLIKVLLGLLRPTGGEVQVLGMDPTVRGAEVRALVGYMPEHDVLPGDVSAAEFVMHMAMMSGLPRNAARERTSDVLRHVGLAEERHRPMGGYSTGMKQRAKLAQAIVHSPQLVLLDEPTNGLDPRSRDDMLDLIGRIGHDFGISVMVTSHLLGELERTVDYVIVIDAGRLLRAERTQALTLTTGSVLVEVLGPPGSDRRIGQALLDHGVRAWPVGDRIEVQVDRPETLDLIRDLIADAGLGLVRLQEVHHSLEEVFAQQGSPV
ncbi:ABC transporter ATP-binding protein [Flexivirga endophytica]|uniref:ABC transporter ATP-binding protein n=1 Tax=Flexivirga endophytica TaxID=1849103 RepID=A0A916TJ56_9MICO|nr:ABC transporter ATP-binding protein [Flexivirga endophytica]GGB46437.1 ABC transporter ATP-binding protein [Flexivirga endophytica]GHB70209.1 ABC transporter ATP-binding protein [Flexivirga endophytica]